MLFHAGSYPVSILLVGTSLAGCASVPTGRVGVEWTPLRGTEEKTLTEGFHVVSPLAHVYQVDLREQQSEDTLDVLANNGLDINLRSSILYQPVATEAYKLITQTGADYYIDAGSTIRDFECAQSGWPIRSGGNLLHEARTDRAGNPRRSITETGGQACASKCGAHP